MRYRIFSLVFYLLVNNNIYIDCVDIPPNPSPDVFQHFQDQNGDTYGTVTIPYTYGTKLNISIAVTAWMPGYYPDIGKTGDSLSFDNTTYQHFLEVKDEKKRLESQLQQSFQENEALRTSLQEQKKQLDELLQQISNLSSQLQSLTSLNEQLMARINRISSRHTPFDDICGRPDTTSSLIYLGEEVPKGAFPWLVAVFKQFGTSGIKYICSGSLISDRHVVTAAHCVTTASKPIKPSEILCVFGKANIKQWSVTPEEITLKPESIFLHPDYKISRGDADISILKFSDSITFNQMIKPLCLWKGSNDLKDVVGDIGIIAGWETSEKEESFAELKQLRLPIVDQLTCLTDGGPSIGQIFSEIISTNTFCAGNRDGSGPCMGDSGAAFVLMKNNTFFLRGIVSTAISNVAHTTCDLFQYVVFTDASKYVDWIVDTMSQ